ncbi:[Fe-Fe] hydrogenase large subunit C-terminal domain-containing protein [Halanaerobium salsuginis]|jgi:iron only hydrogenase large subunit-like protein|uniref:Iron only hydrogenase large subunit, C-terminal domain n=1 Tax=Halanaerobium salsuginis TaxID=29563 RepID=A0A1I4LXL1_9FIRM|nr:[Fe-Fe] hydrogenase large subunit C-terminal domain-containing protein [Halanaerobium salsuginis]SFL95684.1 Iron only hydrogenase large subunit, C-terminal domain [Halanaerobium salsuginis]
MSKKHSVLLKEDKCEGCTSCVKGCPTKAIRVHQGRAWIKEDFCIDCAECIRSCEYHAKYTETDTLNIALKSNYPVLLIPPSFYGQFSPEISAFRLKTAIKELGFKAVYDVSESAAALSRQTLKFLNNNSGSYISTSCPVIVRLIKLQFPDLIEMLLPLKSPVELLAEKIRQEFKAKHNYKPDIFFLTPCPAKLTTVNKISGQQKSFLTGAIGVENIYKKIYDSLEKIEIEPEFDVDQLSLATVWGKEGGEESILNSWQEINTLSVSGISQVKKLLNEIERNNISAEIKYFELTSCVNGCIGGVLNVINPYQAQYNLEVRVRNIIKQQQNKLLNQTDKQDSLYKFYLTENIIADNVSKLDSDFKKAMQKLEQLQREIEILPGLDCAACGAPDCKTFAEDIVNGLAARTDCIFMLRKQLGKLADDLSILAHELPPVMSSKEEDNNNDS